MGRKVFVVGVGMTPFSKPGKGVDYPVMGAAAGVMALQDAGVSYDQVQQAVCSYVYGDSTCGQRCMYDIGLTGIPIYNVNNNCASGSSAIMMAKQLIEGGIAECALALGFEKMEKGSLGSKFKDRTNPMEKQMMRMIKMRGMKPAPGAAQVFGNAGIKHMETYGTTNKHFAKIAEKNHRHSTLNPYSQFRDVYTLEQIEESKPVFMPLTKLQCCPTSDGAAAVVLCSEEFVVKHGLQDRAVEVAGMHLATDMPDVMTGDEMHLAGYGMSQRASKEAMRQAGVTPKDVQVCELHDCFSANELITYSALGLCTLEETGKWIDDKQNDYGGQVVVNPSGGLISKGHPLGATGMAQCCELVWQLRGVAGERQVKNVTAAMQHNLGLGGACVVGIYKKGWPDKADKPETRHGYNPAVEARLPNDILAARAKAKL